MKRKKLKNRLGRRVLSGKITVDEAWRKLGRDISQKSTVPSLAKAESAHGGLTAEVIREAVLAGFRSARPVTEQDVLEAARPLTPPAVTKAAAPSPRQDPREVLKALKSWQSPLDAAPGPVRPWTPAELAMLREADKWSDPDAREGIRAGLIARREGNVT